MSSFSLKTAHASLKYSSGHINVTALESPDVVIEGSVISSLLKKKIAYFYIHFTVEGSDNKNVIQPLLKFHLPPETLISEKCT